jgi:hypothetical protein
VILTGRAEEAGPSAAADISSLTVNEVADIEAVADALSGILR